jgi:hypothetical protein
MWPLARDHWLDALRDVSHIFLDHSVQVLPSLFLLDFFSRSFDRFGESDTRQMTLNSADRIMAADTARFRQFAHQLVREFSFPQDRRLNRHVHIFSDIPIASETDIS